MRAAPHSDKIVSRVQIVRVDSDAVQTLVPVVAETLRLVILGQLVRIQKERDGFGVPRIREVFHLKHYVAVRLVRINVDEKVFISSRLARAELKVAKRELVGLLRRKRLLRLLKLCTVRVRSRIKHLDPNLILCTVVAAQQTEVVVPSLEVAQVHVRRVMVHHLLQSVGVAIRRHQLQRRGFVPRQGVQVARVQHQAHLDVHRVIGVVVHVRVIRPQARTHLAVNQISVVHHGGHRPREHTESLRFRPALHREKIVVRLNVMVRDGKRPDRLGRRHLPVLRVTVDRNVILIQVRRQCVRRDCFAQILHLEHVVVFEHVLGHRQHVIFELPRLA
mmetsp:Transcript_24774/g.81006  ORF Transcript_24774/g.81006 Transcript_24774/m.81006 type:complete len:333 (-) Transcript_24774:275-1273(-)